MLPPVKLSPMRWSDSLEILEIHVFMKKLIGTGLVCLLVFFFRLSETVTMVNVRKASVSAP